MPGKWKEKLVEGNGPRVSGATMIMKVWPIAEGDMTYTEMVKKGS